MVVKGKYVFNSSTLNYAHFFSLTLYINFRYIFKAVYQVKFNLIVGLFESARRVIPIDG